MYINQEVKDLQISLIRQIALKMKEYENGIDFTIGEPWNDIPKDVKEYMAEITLNKKLGYRRGKGV